MSIFYKHQVFEGNAEVQDMAVSTDGTMLVIGRPDLSSVSIYEKLATVPTFDVPVSLDMPERRNFGYAVALSGDLNTIAVGYSEIAVEDTYMAPEFTHVVMFIRNDLGNWIEDGEVSVGLNGVTPDTIRLSFDGLTLTVGGSDLVYTLIKDPVNGDVLDTEDLPLTAQLFERSLADPWHAVKAVRAGNIDGLQQAFGGNAWTVNNVAGAVDEMMVSTEWRHGPVAGCRMYRVTKKAGIWTAPVLDVSAMGSDIVMSDDMTVMIVSVTSNVPQAGLFHMYARTPGGAWSVPTVILKPPLADDLLFALNLGMSSDGLWQSATARHYDAPSGNVYVYKAGVYNGRIVTGDVTRTSFGKITRLPSLPQPVVYVSDGSNVNQYTTVLPL